MRDDDSRTHRDEDSTTTLCVKKASKKFNSTPKILLSSHSFLLEPRTLHTYLLLLWKWLFYVCSYTELSSHRLPAVKPTDRSLAWFCSPQQSQLYLISTTLRVERATTACLSLFTTYYSSVLLHRAQASSNAKEISVVKTYLRCPMVLYSHIISLFLLFYIKKNGPHYTIPILYISHVEQRLYVLLTYVLLWKKHAKFWFSN